MLYGKTWLCSSNERQETREDNTRMNGSDENEKMEVILEMGNIGS